MWQDAYGACWAVLPETERGLSSVAFESARSSSIAVGLGLWAIKGGEDFGGFGADAEVGVGLAEEDGVVLCDDEDAGERETPAGFGGGLVVQAGVIEGNVDEDGLVVAAVLGGDGVGEAELLGYGATGVGEQREVERVLLECEVVLAGGLGGDCDEEGAALAELRVEFAPRFELGDAVGAPAATEEVDDQWAEGEEIG